MAERSWTSIWFRAEVRAGTKGGEALTTLPLKAPVCGALNNSICQQLHGSGVSEAKWHVIWTQSHCERSVFDQLSAAGFNPFLPMIDGWRRQGGSRVRYSAPMFPGYLFLRHAMDKASYIMARQARGIVKFLGERWDCLAVVPDREMETIQKIHDARPPAFSHSHLQTGQRVRVTGGLLADVEGILVRSKPNKGLLIVSIELLQRAVAVEIDCTHVVAA